MSMFKMDPKMFRAATRRHGGGGNGNDDDDTRCVTFTITTRSGDEYRHCVCVLLSKCQQ